MATNNLVPDVVYGLGGGGTEMAFHFLEQEWLLEEVVRPRANRSEDLHVHLFDTATAEQNGVASRVRDVEQRCEELREEYRGTGPTRPGEVTVESTVVTDRMHQNSSTALTGTTEVQNIAEPNGMDADDWWLREEDIDHDLNFAKGVHRRRALAKATLYRAMASREDVRAALDTPEPGRIALFVGLGGGSGSGMLFDVISRLHESDPNNEITVFAALPSGNENSWGVHANAYAALCELEELRLSEDDPLEDVVLYHLDATGYEGKEGDQLVTEGALAEFDEAFAQSVVAYYNADGEDQFNRTEPFAPFTVAVPQVANYNVDAIEEAEALIERRLSELKRMFEADRELVDRAQQVFAELGVPEAHDADLSDEDRVALETRLETLEELADEDLFRELDYVASQRFEEALEDARANVPEEATDDVVALASELQHFATGLSNIDREGRGDTDGLLADVLYAGIQRLAERAELLKRRQEIEDATLRRHVGKYLRVPATGRRELEAAQAQLAGERERLSGELARIEGNLEDSQRELRQRRSERESRVEEATETWVAETETARAELAAHDLSEAETLLRDLRVALEGFGDELQRAESDGEVADADRHPVIEALDGIERYEEEVRKDPMDSFSLVDRDVVETACTTLLEARRLALAANDSPGLVERFVPLTDSGSDSVTARNDLANCREDLQQQGVFNLPNAREQFQVQVTLDVESALESLRDRVSELEARVVETAAEVHPQTPDELDPDAERRVLNAVRRGEDGRETVRSVLAETLADDADLEARVDELAAKRDEVSTQQQRYDPVVSMFEAALSEEYVDFTQAASAAADAREEYDRETRRLGGDGAGAFKRTLQPENVISTAKKDDLADADLLASSVERQVLEDVLDEFQENAMTAEYHGLQERFVEGEETAYYGTDVNVGVVTPVEGSEIRSSMDVGTRLGGAFGVAAPGEPTKGVGVYQTTDERGRSIGPDWGVGVHVFVSGVFLDNLRAVTDQRFRGEYVASTERESQYVHHAHRLEEGLLVRRAAHRYARDEDGAEFYVGSDPAEVADRIRTELLTQVPTHSSAGGADDSAAAADGAGTAVPLDGEENAD